MKPSGLKLAILLTCHNRLEKTLNCLDRLFLCDLPSGVSFDVYLVNDEADDRNGRCVRERFPTVHVIQGSGHLYWCGGMRLAWRTASKNNEYDYYLWLNDDVTLYKYSIGCLIDDSRHAEKPVGAIVGCCCDPISKELTYGGRIGGHMVIPCGHPIPCCFMHGNVVLVPKWTFEIVGGMSSSFTHGFGDSDYSLRVKKAGLVCYVSSTYVGDCAGHQIKTPWLSSKVPLKKRLSYINKPVGANYREYIAYKRMHCPYTWWFYGVKIIVQILLPTPFEWYWTVRAKLTHRKVM